MKSKEEIEAKLKELHARHKLMEPHSHEWWAAAGEASALYWVLQEWDHLKELSEEKMPNEEKK